MEINTMSETNSNDKHEPRGNGNSNSPYSGSDIDPIHCTDRDHEKEKTAFCMVEEASDTSGSEDPSIQVQQNKDNSLEKSEILVNRNTSEMVNGGGLESSNIFTVRDQDEVEENLCCSHEKDGLQKEEEVLKINCKPELTFHVIDDNSCPVEHGKDEKWCFVNEDGPELSSDSATTERLITSQNFCMISESPTNVDLNGLVLPEQGKKEPDINTEKTGALELLNNAVSDASHSKVTEENEDGRTREKILPMLCNFVQAIIAPLTAVVVVNDGKSLRGEFSISDRNQEQRAKTLPRSNISSCWSNIYVKAEENVKNNLKPKVNEFKTPIFMTNQVDVNTYWKQILKGLVIMSQCDDAINRGRKWSFKEFLVHRLRSNYVPLLSSFRQIVYFLAIKSSGVGGDISGYDADDEHSDDVQYSYRGYGDIFFVLPDQGVNSENVNFLDSVVYNEITLDHVNAEEILENNSIDISESGYIEDDELDDDNLSYFGLDDEILYAFPNQGLISDNVDILDSLVCNQITLVQVNPSQTLGNNCMHYNDNGYDADDEWEDTEYDHGVNLDGDGV